MTFGGTDQQKIPELGKDDQREVGFVLSGVLPGRPLPYRFEEEMTRR
jgi:hypothetical protein